MENSHLKTAQDQVPKGGYSIILKPEDSSSAAWFITRTVERYITIYIVFKWDFKWDFLWFDT